MTSHQRKSPGIKKALVTTGTAASLLGASFVAMPATFANVPDQVIKAKDSTMNVMAATDIVERKLAGQLRKYKQNLLAHVGRRDILARFKRGFDRETQ